MRIDWLWIHEYKNLRDLTVDFDEDHLITVLIGRNGTGKSNVLEALTIMFRDLIMGENILRQKNKPSFTYKIRYFCKSCWVYIDANPSRKTPYEIRIEELNETVSDSKSIITDLNNVPGEKISLAKLTDETNGFLPKFVFGYYSGQSDRMERVFQKYLASYDKDLRAGKNPGLKRLFYAQPVHSNFVLLSFIINEAELTNRFLQEQLGLEEGGVDSVLFVLRQPSWKSKEGDPRFWNARGVVADFLAKLYEISLAPIRITRKEPVSLWNKKTLEFLYLYVKDLDALKALAHNKTSGEFFQDLESTHVSELIDEVRIRVKLRKNDGSVTFRELSEGEQQLLTVLGLLRFTVEDESLFLLDEPDTHLNPRWSVDYLKHIDDFLELGKDSNPASHVLLATHNPFAVAELEKEQVQILRRDDDTLKISAGPPDLHPRGMGYAGVVTSDMFGLSAAIDTHTRELLERKRKLALKTEALTNDENIELAEINDELLSYGFRFEVRDPTYSKYLKARQDEINSSLNNEENTKNVTFDRERAKRLIRLALDEEDVEK